LGTLVFFCVASRSRFLRVSSFTVIEAYPSLGITRPYRRSYGTAYLCVTVLITVIPTCLKECTVHIRYNRGEKKRHHNSNSDRHHHPVIHDDHDSTCQHSHIHPNSDHVDHAIQGMHHSLCRVRLRTRAPCPSAQRVQGPETSLHICRIPIHAGFQPVLLFLQPTGGCGRGFESSSRSDGTNTDCPSHPDPQDLHAIPWKRTVDCVGGNRSCSNCWPRVPQHTCRNDSFR